MRIVDTHTHLDGRQFEKDLAEVLDRAAAAGVRWMMCVGTDLASSRRCIELARRFPGRLRAAVGIHPNQWREAGPDDMSEIERLAATPEVVAVGETGLDFHHKFTPPDEQRAAFRRHTLLALSTGKPLIVHSRKSDEEVLRILAAEGEVPPGVRHCFEGSAQVAGRYVELGFHISFAGAVTRPGHKKTKAAARAVPEDRLLVETDCPYQTPAARSGARNEPAFIVDTIEALAALRDEEPATIASLTTANAMRLFFGDPPPAA